MHFLNLSLVETGGLMIWPLILISLIGLIVVIERAFYLHKKQIHRVEFINGVKSVLSQQRLIEAITICEDTPAPISTIIKTALVNYDKTSSQLEGYVRNAAIVEIPSLKKNISIIAAIARLAPIIGLLGTMLGLLNTALNIEKAGGAYANLSILSAGIYEALLTTILGLVIAIFATLTHHFLNARAQSIIQDMEWTGREIIQFLTCEISLKKQER